ncbi:MAG: mechanosensitive ion channel [Deltaproteobacteria bacterium]|nr:mechanosensitive ion channel [Deltaproteobacteria bacterium]
MSRALLSPSIRTLALLAAVSAGAPSVVWAQDPELGPPLGAPSGAPLVTPTPPAAPPTTPPAAPEDPGPDDRLQVDTNEPPLPLPELPPVDEQAPLDRPPLPAAPEVEALPPAPPPQTLVDEAVEAPETAPLYVAPPAPEDTGAVDAQAPTVTPAPIPPAPLFPLPPAPTPSLPRALVFLLFAGLALALSDRAHRWVSVLPKRGLLPSLGRGVVLAGRLCAPLFVLVGALHLLPAAWAVAAPYALVGAALALGWTARDLLRDVLGGVLLSLEGRVQPQARVRFRGLTGVVESLDLRALTLLDDEGQLITIPNRLLVEDVLAVDPDPYAPVEVTVHVPAGVGAQRVHQVLEEMALLSPYLAPSRPPHVYRDPDHKDIWIVSARLVHPRYAKEFRGALVELADEAFGVGGGKGGPR